MKRTLLSSKSANLLNHSWLGIALVIIATVCLSLFSRSAPAGDTVSIHYGHGLSTYHAHKYRHYRDGHSKHYKDRKYKKHRKYLKNATAAPFTPATATLTTRSAINITQAIWASSTGLAMAVSITACLCTAMTITAPGIDTTTATTIQVVGGNLLPLVVGAGKDSLG